MRLAALLAVLVLVASPPHLAAAPFAVQLGTERIVLETPPGFSDTLHLSSPRIGELAESLTSPSNRILLFALTDGDLRRFMGGDPLEARRYMIAATPKGLERTRVTVGQFSGLVVDALSGLGAPARASDYVAHLESQPVGRASLLAELRRDPEAVSVLQGARLPPLRTGFAGWNEKPQYLLSTTTLLLVQGRALNLSIYTGYDGPADLDWLRYVTQRWIDELIRLNSRQ